MNHKPLSMNHRVPAPPSSACGRGPGGHSSSPTRVLGATAGGLPVSGCCRKRGSSETGSAPRPPRSAERDSLKQWASPGIPLAMYPLLNLLPRHQKQPRQPHDLLPHPERYLPAAELRVLLLRRVMVADRGRLKSQPVPQVREEQGKVTRQGPHQHLAASREAQRVAVEQEQRPPHPAPTQAASKTQGKSQAKASHFPSPLSAEKVAEIEKETRGQRTNPEWYKQRANRITASIAPQIANSKFVNGKSSEIPQSYLRRVVESSSGVQTPAMSWGVRNEKKAVQAYEALKSSKVNKAVKVDNCGLFIDQRKPWLAASPDGIIKDADTGKELGVLEVKCPYKHRDRTVTEACKDKSFCLEKVGDSYSLKKNHQYYTQLQVQMGVTGLPKGELVVHTNKETAIAPVDFDPVFWETTASKLEKFYVEAVVPCQEEKKSAAAWAKEE
ncbi:coiled-coil domain-containing protein 8-like [Podarcis lilfordi]|uniref:Coiled-coil domain-containing protein 8-like n=1 Tax=Podarcis lilfordi TaxID=74358 RepID=A0AA35P5Q8_9SAUR|nr:coiled-coil domain-containing protein 8-like [Podarcis lilfordi]